MSPNKILVANIGSTSFKFRLIEMPSERVLAKGGVERIGSPESIAASVLPPYSISTVRISSNSNFSPHVTASGTTSWNLSKSNSIRPSGRSRMMSAK